MTTKVKIDLKRGQQWSGMLLFDGGEFGGVKCGHRSVTAHVGSKWVKMQAGRHRGKIRRNVFAEWIARPRSRMELQT